MDTNLNNLQQEADANRKRLVDNEEASEQRLPGAPGRSVRGQDWTSILRKANLEAPGYRETIEKMKQEGKLG